MVRSAAATRNNRPPQTIGHTGDRCRACMLVDAATFAMAIVASISVDSLADPAGRFTVWRAGVGMMWTGIAIAMRFAIGRIRAGDAPVSGKHGEQLASAPAHRSAPPLSLTWTIALALITVAPLMLEPLLRRGFGEGRPLEIQLLLGLRNLSLGLAALSLWPVCARLSAAVSLCLMLFSQVVDDSGSVTWLLGIFSIAGAGWLLVSYEARFADLVIATGETRLTESKQSPARRLAHLPWRGVACVVLSAIAIFTLWFSGPKAPLASLGEWIGSSGGAGANDPFARGGVNDGLEEVGGENPETAGFAETDKFLDSDQPTLYDAASDLFGEPARKKNRQQERMISVTASDVKEIKNHAENKRASREFATARTSPKRPRSRPADRDARALFEVQGRTPLHLRMDVLARYDGEKWSALQFESCPNVIEAVGQSSRMRIFMARIGDYYGPDELHRLKIASLGGSISPTPSLLSQFQVGLIDRAEFFEWRRDGVLQFRGRARIPSGTTVETYSRTANLLALSPLDVAGQSSGNLPTYREVPSNSHEAFEKIASEWIGSLPRGAEQVAAILRRLREEYRLDSQSTIESQDGDPVLEFLATKKSGPDYLFASAAVLLLRSKGYPARLAVGYYASPAAFDAWTRHTPVVEEDLHFWPELLLADGNWLALEPTPGFETLLPRPTLWQRVISAATMAMSAAIQHPWMTLVILVSIVFLSVYRLEVIDSLRLARMRLFPERSWRERAFTSMRLLEKRAASIRTGRGSSQTLAAWSMQFAARPDGASLQALVQLTQDAAYGPALDPENVELVCRRAEKSWTLKKFRSAYKSKRSTANSLSTHLTLNPFATDQY